MEKTRAPPKGKVQGTGRAGTLYHSGGSRNHEAAAKRREEMYIERIMPEKAEIELCGNSLRSMRKVREKLMKKEDVHVAVEIKGTQEDFRKAVTDIRKAVKKHNRSSDKKMSYDIKLLKIT